MSLDYPHYAVELAIALAIILSVVFAIVVFVIVAARMRLICWFFGHDYDPYGIDCAGVYDCQRCGHYGLEQRSVCERVARRIHYARYRLSETLYPLSEWLRCSRCGRRFGRHDPSNDHIPF